MDSHDLLTIGEVSHRSGGPLSFGLGSRRWSRSATG